MWIPANTEELESKAQAEQLIETDTFDAKAFPNSSKDIATDVAAMSTDGGCILYGIGEDPNGRPTLLQPFELKGVRERLAQIIETCIFDAPQYKAHTFISTDDPNRGYILLEVPASAQAPHMVIVNGDYRFYGRRDAKNARLTQGEIDRLYVRRDAWRRNGELFLDEAIRQTGSVIGFGNLHIVVQPLLTAETAVDDATGTTGYEQVLNDCMMQANTAFRTKNISSDYNFSGGWSRRSGGWIAYLGDRPYRGQPRKFEREQDLYVNRNGSGKLYWGGIAQMETDHNLRHTSLQLDNLSVPLIIARAIAFFGHVLQKAEYNGPVDIAIGVTGIAGALPRSERGAYHREPFPYENEQYRSVTRCSAVNMVEQPRSTAHTLTDIFMRETTHDYIDPFTLYTNDPQ